jgi:hypothetical protein
MWISKRFRVAVVLFLGRYGCALRCVLIDCVAVKPGDVARRFLAAPYAVPLTAVVGAPILVSKVRTRTPFTPSELSVVGLNVQRFSDGQPEP